MGVLRGQEGLEGQRSDGERYRLDGTGRERVREGSRQVSRQNLGWSPWSGALWKHQGSSGHAEQSVHLRVPTPPALHCQLASGLLGYTANRYLHPVRRHCPTARKTQRDMEIKLNEQNDGEAGARRRHFPERPLILWCLHFWTPDLIQQQASKIGGYLRKMLRLETAEPD